MRPESGERMVDAPTLLVHGGVVVDVGVSGPADATTVAFADGTLLPGLIDCHQHLCFGGHCWYLGGECTGDSELRRAVRVCSS